MVSKNIRKWLKARRRNGIILSSLYAVVAVAGGVIALGLTFCLAFLVLKILVLFMVPTGHFATVLSTFLASGFVVFLWLDSLRASRYESLVVSGWIFREAAEIGPRAIRDGCRSALRAVRLMQLDVATCAGVLTMLAAKNKAVSRVEVARAFPELVWSTLVLQLRQLEGVLFLGPAVSRLALIQPLRLELHNLWQAEEIEQATVEEPLPPEVVAQPEPLTPAELLGVSPEATTVEIKLAYRQRIKECHPDRFPGMDEQSRQVSEEWTKTINAAYEALMAGHKNRNGE